MNIYRVSGPEKQRGVALIVVLILLAGITLISTASVNTSVMELRMAQNLESNANNFQTALAAVDFVIADPDNLPAGGPLNIPATVSLTDPMFTQALGDTITATASRIEDCAPPPRMRAASSLLAYSSFKYEISAAINRNASGMGQSGIAQGYLQMGPKC